MSVEASDVLKVSARSNPNLVAGAVAGMLRDHGAANVQVVGAGALNQAIKAVAIARGYVAEGGFDLVCVPTFADVEIEGEKRTAIRLLVEDRDRRTPDEIGLAEAEVIDLTPAADSDVPIAVTAIAAD